MGRGSNKGRIKPTDHAEKNTITQDFQVSTRKRITHRALETPEFGQHSNGIGKSVSNLHSLSFRLVIFCQFFPIGTSGRRHYYYSRFDLFSLKSHKFSEFRSHFECPFIYLFPEALSLQSHFGKVENTKLPGHLSPSRRTIAPSQVSCSRRSGISG